ncbi:MAG TPA: MEDS domain-containing protein [Chitinophagaceae bacterium]|nr:MEDS domain-containing protein [Chitinophagaceae bacterium]
MSAKINWKRENVDIFWGEIAPCDHVVQIYENDTVFLDALAGFIGGGIKGNECVIVIATDEHLESLHERLAGYGIGVNTLIDDDRYIPLNAEETLEKFMVNGWPDEELFNKTVSAVINRGICKGRRIRAFGEMVAILWAQGHNGATVHLEHLWNKFSAKHRFSLFCAYPKSGFTQNINESISNICGCHTKMIDGNQKQLSEVMYSEILQKVS